MTRTMRTFLKQNKESYRIPRRVQDAIPIKRIWEDGLFLAGTRYSMVYQFTDINYFLASEGVQKEVLKWYENLLNSLDDGVLNKITTSSAHVNQRELGKRLCIAEKPGILLPFRQYYNRMLVYGGDDSNSCRQKRYLTIAVYKRNEKEARMYFDRKTAELKSAFGELNVTCEPLNATERLRILHDFYRPEDQEYFSLNYRDCVLSGNDPIDYICPGSMERHASYIMIGDHYCRTMYLKYYASNMKDTLIPSLTDLSRSMMISFR